MFSLRAVPPCGFLVSRRRRKYHIYQQAFRRRRRSSCGRSHATLGVRVRWTNAWVERKIVFFITKWMSMYGGPREKDSFWDKGEMSPWVQRTNDALGAKKTGGVGSKVKRLLWASGKKAVVGPTGKKPAWDQREKVVGVPPTPEKSLDPMEQALFGAEGKTGCGSREHWNHTIKCGFGAEGRLLLRGLRRRRLRGPVETQTLGLRKNPCLKPNAVQRMLQGRPVERPSISPGRSPGAHKWPHVSPRGALAH